MIKVPRALASLLSGGRPAPGGQTLPSGPEPDSGDWGAPRLSVGGTVKGDISQRARSLLVPKMARNRMGVALNCEKFVNHLLTNNWLFTGVFRIATSAPQARMVIKRRGKEVGTSDPWYQRLHYPNPWVPRHDFYQATMAWLETCGNAFWLNDPEATPSGLPYLYVARPSNMVVMPDPQGLRPAAGYVHQVALGARQAEVFYPAETVVHFKYWSPLGDQWGLPHQAFLGEVLETDENASLYNRMFFKRGANMTGVLEYAGTIPGSDYERLLREFRERFHGVQNAHTPIILQGGLQWKQTGAAHKDLEFLQGREANREAILGAMGVPPALAGVFRYANYANARAQYSFFWKETLWPKLRGLAAALTLWVQRWDPDITVEFDISEVPALEETLLDQAKRLTMLLQGNAITINEARDVLDLLPLAGGDVTVGGLQGTNLEAALQVAGIGDYLDLGEAASQPLPWYAEADLAAAVDEALSGERIAELVRECLDEEGIHREAYRIHPPSTNGQAPATFAGPPARF